MVVAFQKKLNRLRYASPIRVSCMWVMDIWFFLKNIFIYTATKQKNSTNSAKDP
jgi:hypothetical protein